MANELGRMVLDNFRYRLTADYPTQIHACLNELTDEQIWWRPNSKSNSIGNLILHLCGSLRRYFGTGVGARPYERDRPREFAETGPIPRAELIAQFNGVIREMDGILYELSPERLTETSDRTEYNTSIYQLALGVTVHLALHTGQIIYVTKMLKGGAFEDELWRRPRVRVPGTSAG